MQNTDNPKNPYIGLARWGQGGNWQWYLAALGAGWLSFVKKPPIFSGSATSLKQVLFAGVLLIAILLAAGHILSFMAPIFSLFGQMSGTGQLVTLFAMLNLWRFAKGRKILLACVADFSKPANAPSSVSEVP